MAKLGISTSVHFIPMFLHPYWRDTYHLSPQDFPRAMQCYSSEVSLPNFTRMTDEQLQRVIDATQELLA